MQAIQIIQEELPFYIMPPVYDHSVKTRSPEKVSNLKKLPKKLFIFVKR